MDPNLSITKKIFFSPGWLFAYKQKLFFRQIDHLCPNDMFIEIDRNTFKVNMINSYIFNVKINKKLGDRVVPKTN